VWLLRPFGAVCFAELSTGCAAARLGAACRYTHGFYEEGGGVKVQKTFFFPSGPSGVDVAGGVVPFFYPSVPAFAGQPKWVFRERR